MEDLEDGLLEYKIAGEFLVEIKRKFERGDKEGVKVAELKRIEQRGKMIEEFIQEFRKAVRGNRYKGRPLVEKFKREINRTICVMIIFSCLWHNFNMSIGLRVNTAQLTMNF